MRFTNRIVFRKQAAGLEDTPRSGRVQQSCSSLPRLRDQWPFLNEPGVPVELQALVTQKITRYHEYSNLYARLRDCQSVDELSTACEKLLDAYLDNQAITRELDYYQRHGKPLGRHPMMRHFQELTRLRSSSVKELLREQQKTKDNIWRVNSEIRKGDKPHLDEKRRQKLQEYNLKLQEISRLLGE